MPEWKKGIVIRAFADTPDFLGGTGFIRSTDDFSRIFRAARESRFQGVQPYLDIDSGVLNLLTPDPTLKDIARRAADEGVELPSLEIAPLQYSFTSDDGTERTRGIDVVRRAITVASRLGVPGLLVIPGYVGKMWDPATDKVDYEAAYERTLHALAALAPEAESARVRLLLEPIWNMFLLSPLELRRLVDEVGSDHCGVLLDTGNITLFGFAEQWIRILGSRIREIHMKDFRRSVGGIDGFVPLLSGDVNWAAVTEAAQMVDFEGYWIAEQFPYQQYGRAVLSHTSIAMDYILGRGPDEPAFPVRSTR